MQNSQFQKLRSGFSFPSALLLQKILFAAVFINHLIINDSYASADLAGVNQTMDIYIAAHSDPKLFAGVMHESAVIEGYRSGFFLHLTRVQFLANTKNLTPTNHSKMNAYEVLSFNKNTAIARATVYVGPTCFIDYLSMANMGGQWKVLYKSFSDDCAGTKHNPITTIEMKEK